MASIAAEFVFPVIVVSNVGTIINPVLGLLCRQLKYIYTLRRNYKVRVIAVRSSRQPASENARRRNARWHVLSTDKLKTREKEETEKKG